jgi:carbon storage regulator CsrA
MLVISRDVDESLILYFGETRVRIVALERHGRCARLGIEAPPEVKILREELGELEPEEPGKLTPARLTRAISEALAGGQSVLLLIGSKPAILDCVDRFASLDDGLTARLAIGVESHVEEAPTP